MTKFLSYALIAITFFSFSSDYAWGMKRQPGSTAQPAQDQITYKALVEYNIDGDKVQDTVLVTHGWEGVTMVKSLTQPDVPAITLASRYVKVIRILK